jgi:DNA-binding Xre family transcriptional regulator
MKRNKTNDKAFEEKLTIFLKIIGKNLYALRSARKESLKTVAKATSISSATIRKLEKGHSQRFRLLTLNRLCHYYEINLSDVVSD